MTWTFHVHLVFIMPSFVQLWSESVALLYEPAPYFCNCMCQLHGL